MINEDDYAECMWA